MLAEVALAFLKLGLFAFGGPAAHIAMMEDEFVTRRKWVTPEHFLDLVGATNLIPGPNSTEMTMHLGYERAGWRGLLVAGACFIGPAVTLTGMLAWFYVTYGSLPQVAPFFAGIKPAVIAIIAGALYKLGGKAVKTRQLGLVAALVFTAVLAGCPQIPALLAGGLLAMLWLRKRAPSNLTAALLLLSTRVAKAATQVSNPSLFLFFLKIGSILYGSGYVLVAFLEEGLVQQLGWLTQAQLLDAIAIGQFTPGPVLSTATFIGFLVNGPSGALSATVGIFLPSFLFVWLLNPLIPRMRKSVWLSAFLDGVNVSALALMATVVVQLSLSTLVTGPAWIILLVALVGLRFEVNSAWLVLAGALLGRLLL
ncbi:MAG: chromate efflux transporter [Vulcanimicrobiota bacterium]